MGHSMAPVNAVPTIEDYVAHVEFSAGNRTYRVSREGESVYHHELMRDNLGVIYDQRAEVEYALGSGTQGRGYLLNRQGLLFASPISWYTEETRWDLSPGYELHRHRRFSRRIGDECLSCHAGRMATVAGQADTFRPQPFLEMAIGCERCHGPGKEHVERQRSSTPPAADRSIVNPGRLDFARRDSVCNQCHLVGEIRVLRYGRSWHDFRPGQLLEEVWSVLSRSERAPGDGTSGDVGQVEEMMASTCFQKSGGRLGCISCHDPHEAPALPEKLEHYRARCLDCHNQQGCSLEVPERLSVSPADSCVECHMPRRASHGIAHASQTDHRILRRTAAAPSGRLEDAPLSSLAFFDHSEVRLPSWEASRARGLALVELAQRQIDPIPLIEEAEQLLQPVVEVVRDDVPSLKALGQILSLKQDHTRARKILEQALEIAPGNESVLALLVIVCRHTGDHDAGLTYVDRLLQLNPGLATMHAQKAAMLAAKGNWPAALRAAEEALQLDPTIQNLRQWLTGRYQQAGLLEEARRHADIFERIKAASP